jgi:hypothetical protein
MSVSYECCVFCQVEVSATGRLLFQGSANECGVSESDQVVTVILCTYSDWVEEVRIR